MLWELRYRAARGVDNVQVETEGMTEGEARELSHWYLDTLGSPTVRFVYVRPIVVARTADMRKALEAKAKVATAAAKEVIERKGKPAPSEVLDPKENHAVGAGPNKGRVGS